MIKMATHCLACGQEVLKGSRAAASTVHGLLKSLIAKRCWENDLELDLDSVIACSYVCRGCCRAYETHIKKEERLYDATATAFPLIDDASVPTYSPGKRRAITEDNTSVLHSATKRRCLKSTSDSPPVVVLMNI